MNKRIWLSLLFFSLSISYALYTWSAQIRFIKWSDLRLEPTLIEEIMSQENCYSTAKSTKACLEVKGKMNEYLNTSENAEMDSLHVAQFINMYYSRAYDPHTYIMPKSLKELGLNINKIVTSDKKGNTLTIKIGKVNEGSCDQVRGILNNLEDGIDSIKLDLQDNPGGSISEAQCILSQFINSSEPLFKIQFRDNNHIRDYFATEQSNYSGKLSVEINPHTGSSAELIASVLQYYKRAEIIGKNSFGKATVQEVQDWPLHAGVSLYKTVGKMLLPDGKSHYMVGVTPDLIVNSQFDIKMSEVKTVLEAL